MRRKRREAAANDRYKKKSLAHILSLLRRVFFSFLMSVSVCRSCFQEVKRTKEGRTGNENG